MRCDTCNHENPSEARFCNECGAPLASRCSSCDRVNPPGSRFCNGCGTPLDSTERAERDDPRVYTPRHLAQKILQDKSALEGERKHVTVLFADLANSTAFAESVDPEEMHALMDRAFQLILEQVHRYEGTVNQFTGDGVMALFGAPIALEDAPHRAVNTALAIQRALAPLDADVRERHGREFRMRIGIHTGLVVVGSIGDDLRMDYTAVGDTTNLAARLQQFAQPGTVVISDATKRLVDGFFDVQELPPAMLKGKKEAVSAFEVVAARAVSSRIDAVSATDLTEYVGRSSELDTLLTAFDSAAQGRGQVAFIVGEAGIGKSRLIHEFRQKLSDTAHTWIEGRCSSYSRTTPFYALADGLRRRFGIEDRDDESAALARLERHEADFDDELQWTLPFVRRLLSLPTGSAEVDDMEAIERRGRTSRALQLRFQRAAELRPLVLVIEDLHWVDTASEEFLGFLADSIAASRILLILTHRPGYQHPFGDRSFHIRVPIQALTESDMAAMAGAVLDTEELPADLRRIIAEKAEGNPLFVEEVTRSLLEEGVLSIEQGRVRLARELDKVTIPNRIQDVLMARLDRLPAEPKQAIQMASVIGREFALRLLDRITEMGERLDGVVGELRGLELIYEKSSHPELAYMFKHALTHDVAYESVLLQRRKALHRIVGSAIEELYQDRLAEHYEALAHHFGEAEDWERALQYHTLASEKSVDAYANHSAIEHCRAALDIAERVEGGVSNAARRSLAFRLANCAWCVSDFQMASTAFQLAGRLTDDPGGQALAIANAGFCDVWAHDYDRARESHAAAGAMADAHDSDAARAMTLIVADELDIVHGRNLTDDSEVERSIALAEQSGDAAVLIAALAQAAQRCEWRGDYRRSIHFAKRGVSLAATERMAGNSLFAQWFLGMAYVAVGEYTNGIALFERGLESCELIGDRAVRARLLNTLGWTYSEIGSHRRAGEFNRMSNELGREMVDVGLVAGPELYANASINLAGNRLALGDLDGAAELLEPVRRLMVEDDDEWMRWRYSLHLRHIEARIELARGEPDRALAIIDEEIAGAREIAAQKLEARALELRGRTLLVLDRREESAAALEGALAIAGRIEHPPVMWRSLALSGELARREGDGRRADDRMENAGRLIEDKAAGLRDADLRNDLLGLGESLAADPVGGHR